MPLYEQNEFNETKKEETACNNKRKKELQHFELYRSMPVN
jgi:hypothetical protein